MPLRGFDPPSVGSPPIWASALPKWTGMASKMSDTDTDTDSESHADTEPHTATDSETQT